MPPKKVSEQRAYAREYYHNKIKQDPEKMEVRRERAREYYRNNKSKQKFRLTLKKYGITEEQYDAMYHAQNKQCAICRGDAGPHELAVDHCHATGKIRGLLCLNCNKALGFFKDNIEALDNAVLYLRSHG